MTHTPGTPEPGPEPGPEPDPSPPRVWRRYERELHHLADTIQHHKCNTIGGGYLRRAHCLACQGGTR